MPLVCYRRMRSDGKWDDVSKKMPSPKKIERLDHWYRDARKLIPQMPNIYPTPHNPRTADDMRESWFQESVEHDTTFITFRLRSNLDETALVIIDRRVPHMGPM